MAEKNDRRGSYGHTDEGVKRHRGRQAESLARHLRLLRFRIAREVWDVQRHCGPETDHRGERWNEDVEEFAGRFEFAGSTENWAKSASFACDPKQKQKTDS